jgi:YbbR domain-containing protein
MDFLRRLFFENVGLKLFSIVLAFTLWLIVHRDPVAEVAIEVPIEFHNIPPNVEISTDAVYRSTVRLRGPERVIHQLSSADVHAEIDLTGLRPGERTFDVTAQQIHHPHELSVVQIVPSEFHVTFDTELTRQVPVKPRIIGNFASGYEIAQVVVNPTTVPISGPQKHVEAVDAAITDPIDVSGLMQQGSFVRHAYVSDPLVQVANPNPVRITVIMKQTQGDGSAH